MSSVEDNYQSNHNSVKFITRNEVRERNGSMRMDNKRIHDTQDGQRKPS